MTNLYSRVVSGMDADGARLCAQDSMFETVSLLESEVFRARLHVDCAAESTAFLAGIWHQEAVDTVLSQSKEIARSFK